VTNPDINEIRMTSGDGAARAFIDDATPYQLKPEVNGNGNTHGEQKQAKITATPWTWRDPIEIKRRSWLHGTHYIRGVLTATVGKRGHGKTTRAIAEIASMVTGRDLLNPDNTTIGDKLRWWYIGEDHRDEIERHFVALFEYYGITERDVGDRLIFNSLRDFPPGTFKLANRATGDKVVHNNAAIDGLIAAMKAQGVDGLLCDPLRRFHGLRENDQEMDEVMAIFDEIADEAQASVEFLHHTRKGLASNNGAAITIDDTRGADAIIAGPRDVRLINQMTVKEALAFGINPNEAWRYVRLDDGKQNLKPPGQAIWTKLASHYLPCGESVGVATAYKVPTLFEGITKTDAVVAQRLAEGAEYRADIQAKNWFGYALGKELGLDPLNDKAHKAKLSGMIKTWLKNKVLKLEGRKDEHGKDKHFIARGPTNLNEAEDVEL
jgi:hypothetical protein